MMNFLDIKTLIFTIVIIEVFLATIMMLFTKRQKGYPGFTLWALHLFFLIISMSNMIFRDIIPPIISVPLSNVFNILAILMVFEASHRFYYNKPIDKKWYIIVPLVFIGAVYGILLYDDITFRTVMISGFSAIIAFQVAHVFFKNISDDEKIISSLLSLLYGFLGFTLIFRIIDFTLHPTGRTLFEQTTSTSALYLGILFISIGATLLFIILNLDRLARERDKYFKEKEMIASRYELAVETAGMGLWQIDQDTLKLTGDNQILEMAGIKSPDDAFELSLEKLIYPEDLSRLITYIKGATKENEKISAEYRIVGKDGDIKYHISHAKSYRKTDDSRLYFIGLTIDVTPLRKAQIALKKALEKLSILSSITRHDILNSITAISLTTELLKMDITDPSIQKELNSIAESTTEITRLIKFTGEYQDLGISEPMWIDITNILKKLSSSPLLKNIILKIPEPGVLLYSDQMIEKVIYNLIENSVRHGQTVTTISLSYEYDTQDLLVLYTDDGCGIEESEKNLIFKRGHGKNTGLGLALSRDILAITNLTIVENGTPGKGVRFEIRAKPGSFHDNRK
ncbi:multi-sensor signal transduction histidine kinase [Methanospirillum hungatei JF-1]|jgi:PAS domain S-box-containing protein|uniref:histidine kinase n=1 Tax=Methanospirillum hungatei JF-1 (strain ATCC 27890 / DSM 864 / NBRC 100397 / JF-1) TaxID=323259 RepID=Q2FMM5_METHJ|nr:ATP-binding protein [Methanospirillum hungatei]ABD40453.1 multi-sensor signal transduction histidine kinase [Methanospirillum hungatei JF-1]